MVFSEFKGQVLQLHMLRKSSTSTRQPPLDHFSSKDRSNSATSSARPMPRTLHKSRSCTISKRRVPLSTSLMNDCGRPRAFEHCTWVRPDAFLCFFSRVSRTACSGL
ncbi:hypothetical protein PflSS101_3921 [Pseudomonas lactis]|uniref:Uncharacterized protein n=1 Tax=Pseudomonas lactis TaxID=1615674 RepID=I4KGS8_9PSED|nr:hypothetical protein PflSS101_3921 [Pseudomonas lactis]